MKQRNVFANEGNVRWAVISRDRHVLGDSTGGTDSNRTLTNPNARSCRSRSI
jgi:hypothetical protein